jgi:hypothetical protein
MEALINSTVIKMNRRGRGLPHKYGAQSLSGIGEIPHYFLGVCRASTWKPFIIEIFAVFTAKIYPANSWKNVEISYQFQENLEKNFSISQINCENS